MPAVMNAANEVAVQLFLAGKLKFTAIPRLVAACMDEHTVTEATDIQTILAADHQARSTALQLAAAFV